MFTKSAEQVFAVTNEIGQPRAPNNADTLTWAKDVERELVLGNDARGEAIEGVMVYVDQSVGDEATIRNNADTALSGRIDAAEATANAAMNGVVPSLTEVAGGQTVSLASHNYSNGTAGVGATLTATANAALANSYFDSYGTVTVGHRLWVRLEGAKNGIYTVTQVGSVSLPWILTRATDADTAAEIGARTFAVRAGSTLAGERYQVQQKAADITIGTTSLTFAMISDEGSYAAELVAARNGKANLNARLDTAAVEEGFNVLKYGFLDGGPLNPTIVGGSVISEIPKSINTLRNRGFTHAFLWRNANEYVRYEVDPDERSELFGKYVCAGFFAHSISGTFMPYAIIRLEGDGSVNATISSAVHSYQAAGTNTRMLYEFGQMPNVGDTFFPTVDDLIALRIGYSSNPAGANTIRATGFFLAFRDTPWTVADMPVMQRSMQEILDRQKPKGPTVTFNSTLPYVGEIAVNRGVNTVVRRFTFKPPERLISVGGQYGPAFMMTADVMNGENFRITTDDNAPYFVNSGHQGGVHGFLGALITATGHGKDDTDVGSQWTLSGNTYVLMQVVSANQILLTRKGVSAVVPTGTFVHSTGAAHTASIVATVAAEQFFWNGMTKDYRMTVYVDGRPVEPNPDTLTYEKNVAFVESYGVVDREEFIDEYVANGVNASVDNLSPLFLVKNSYVYDKRANITLYGSFHVLRTVTLGFLYGLQAQHAGATHFYVPKTNPITHDGVSKNFSLIEEAVAQSTEVSFNSANTVAGGLFLDRFYSMNADYLFVMGFTPLQIGDVADRRSTYVTGTNVGMTIATSRKAYMRAVNTGSHTASPGERYDWTAYRNIVFRNSDRTCDTIVETTRADYLILDWHNINGIDYIQMDPDMLGRPFTVVEKSANVTIMDDPANGVNGELMVDRTTSGTYGYAMLEFEK